MTPLVSTCSFQYNKEKEALGGKMADPFVMEDGSHIGVIGGGPTGSFFSIFALKMAKMFGKNISVTIFEPKNFTKDGPLGCNRCGGVISELLVQNLAMEGIILPDSIVQRGISSYKLHTDHGSVHIETPTFERTIATVYRGGGPKGTTGDDKESFDNFLLNLAIKEGAHHIPVRIHSIEFKNGRPAIYSKETKLGEPDLVVGAIGIKSQTSKLFEDIGFGYSRPATVTAAIAEIEMDNSMISDIFGNSVHLFLIPVRGIKFAAMIPKGTYVTICILGDSMDTHTIDDFIRHPAVKAVLPEEKHFSIGCRCLPKMNIQAPSVPFADRVVVCGDAGSTRLFKDGIGAAYVMGKAAAKTAVFRGIGKQHFQKEYYPVYKSIVHDNLFGRFLFSVTDIFKKYKPLTKGMLNVVRKEQSELNDPKILSSILWDMFTGNERYKNIFMKTVHVRMGLHLCNEVAKTFIRRDA
jgi:flavin-dependent dehydrogenase